MMLVITPTTSPSSDSFSELVRRTHRLVLAVAFAWVHDRGRAEEVTQDVFLVAWHRIQAGEQLRDPEAWLARVARNLARNTLRKHRRETSSTVDVADPRAPADMLASAHVRDALARLAPAYREPLILFYWNGESIKDVATDLGLAEAVVKQRLSRGRRRVRHELEQLERALRATVPPSAAVAALLVAVDSRRAEAAALASSSAVATTATGTSVGAAGISIGAVAMMSAAALVGAGVVIAYQATRTSAAAVPHESEHTSTTTTVTQPASSSSVRPTLPHPAPHWQPLAASSGAVRPLHPEATVDFDFIQAPINDLLRILGETAGIDIVVAPGVAEKVDVRFKNAPASQVLDYVFEQSKTDHSDIALVRVVADPGKTCTDLPDGDPITIRFYGTPLRDVVHALEGSLDRPVAISYDPGTELVDASFEAIPAGRALRELLAREHLGCELATGWLVGPK